MNPTLDQNIEPSYRFGHWFGRQLEARGMSVEDYAKISFFREGYIRAIIAGEI